MAESDSLPPVAADMAGTPEQSVAGPIKAEVDPIVLPQRLVRVERKGHRWGMPRRFAAFSVAGPEQLSVRGAASKCIIRHKFRPNDWYIAKAAESYGEIETLTELLNNLIGQRLGFPMAHAGLLRADGELQFASFNFQAQDETLIHGSLLFREVFNDDLASVGKNPWDEQRTYDIELIADLLNQVCGDAAMELMPRLIEMLVFDALIGSMDRHMQNWGLVATIGEPRRYRFAPIFDSARALLWNYDEDKLKVLLRSQHALDGYINRSRPKIGTHRKGRAMNHFELIEHLVEGYPVPTREALKRIRPEKVQKVAEIVREFPFSGTFSRTRKHLIVQVLAKRADKLFAIAQEGR